MMVEFKQAYLEAEYKEEGYAHIIATAISAAGPATRRLQRLSPAAR